MYGLKTPNKNAGLRATPQRPATTINQSIRYTTRESLSSTKQPNHTFFLTQGRHVFERPANWNVRLHR